MIRQNALFHIRSWRCLFRMWNNVFSQMMIQLRPHELISITNWAVLKWPCWTSISWEYTDVINYESQLKRSDRTLSKKWLRSKMKKFFRALPENIQMWLTLKTNWKDLIGPCPTSAGDPKSKSSFEPFLRTYRCDWSLRWTEKIWWDPVQQVLEVQNEEFLTVCEYFLCVSGWARVHLYLCESYCG